jgi:uncharacterized membrane protein
MRRVYQTITWISLAATILPSILFLAGRITLDQSKAALLVATIAWFVSTPLWMGRKPEESAS